MMTRIVGIAAFAVAGALVALPELAMGDTESDFFNPANNGVTRRSPDQLARGGVFREPFGGLVGNQRQILADLKGTSATVSQARTKCFLNGTQLSSLVDATLNGVANTRNDLQGGCVGADKWKIASE